MQLFAVHECTLSATGMNHRPCLLESSLDIGYPDVDSHPSLYAMSTPPPRRHASLYSPRAPFYQARRGPRRHQCPTDDAQAHPGRQERPRLLRAQHMVFWGAPRSASRARMRWSRADRLCDPMRSPSHRKHATVGAQVKRPEDAHHYDRPHGQDVGAVYASPATYAPVSLGSSSSARRFWASRSAGDLSARPPRCMFSYVTATGRRLPSANLYHRKYSA